jgi:hypothetical protein
MLHLINNSSSPHHASDALFEHYSFEDLFGTTRGSGREEVPFTDEAELLWSRQKLPVAMALTKQLFDQFIHSDRTETLTAILHPRNAEFADVEVYPHIAYLLQQLASHHAWAEAKATIAALAALSGTSEARKTQHRKLQMLSKRSGQHSQKDSSLSKTWQQCKSQ